MADFVKIRVGDEGKDVMLNLDAIKSVYLDSRHVYTVGSTQPYIIKDEKSWKKIIDHVGRNTVERFF